MIHKQIIMHTWWSCCCTHEVEQRIKYGFYHNTCNNNYDKHIHSVLWYTVSRVLTNFLQILNYCMIFSHIRCSLTNLYKKNMGGHLVSTRVHIRDRDQDLDRPKFGLDRLIVPVKRSWSFDCSFLRAWPFDQNRKLLRTIVRATTFPRVSVHL